MGKKKIATEFTEYEWKEIMKTIRENPLNYGLPQRQYGSFILASFNIRKLGAVQNRSKQTWEFLAYICSHFDLISVQEIMEDLSGVYELKKYLGPEFDIIISDTTGVFPGGQGMGERLAFIFRQSLIQRADVATDISLDRTKILETIATNFTQFEDDIKDLILYFEKINERQKGDRQISKPKKPKVKLTFFLDFIRSPYCVAFRIRGHPDAEPYEFMAVNAHLYFGNYISDRELEFNALIEWIINRAKRKDKTYFPNFILLGDLNLNFDHPEKDRNKIMNHIKTFNDKVKGEINVNFPFIDIHPKEIELHDDKAEVYRTNARLTETFDQIGLFFTDPRFPTFEDNKNMGKAPENPDYGVFNFVDLFSMVINDKPLSELSKSKKKQFIARFEHKVSDHMPLWLRLPLPRID